MFYRQFHPCSYRDAKQAEFLRLRQGTMSNEASAPIFNFQNLLQPQLIQVDVQDDVSIAGDVDDEYEDEATQEEDEEQQLNEEEDVNVDGEDDEEEYMQRVVDEAIEEPQRELGDVPSDDHHLQDLLSVLEEEDEVDENTVVKKVRPTTRIKTYQSKHVCGRMQETKFATSSWLAQRFDGA
ncbi:unnamed protein product [Prunus brigantina]